MRSVRPGRGALATLGLSACLDQWPARARPRSTAAPSDVRRTSATRTPSHVAAARRAPTRSPTTPPRSSTPPPASTAQTALAAHDRERARRAAVHGRLPDDLGARTRPSRPSRPTTSASVILDGTSQAGLAATQRVTAQLRALAPHGVGLFISTDQEGGAVQRLQGPGFDQIPSAVDAGQLDPARLRADAGRLGRPTARGRRQRQPRPGARHRPRRLRPATRPSATWTASTATTRQRSPVTASAFAQGMLAGRRRPHRQTLPRPRPGHRQHRHDQRASPTTSPHATTPTSRRSQPRSATASRS